MGTPLRPRPRQSGARPGALPHRRDAQRGRSRLGSGRRAEKRRAERVPGPDRDQDPAYGPAPRPCRTRRRNSVFSPHRSWGNKHSRHAHPLAHRHGRKRPCPFRHGRPRHGLLAPFPRTQPGRRKPSSSATRGRANNTPSSRPEAGRANTKPSSSAARGRANREPSSRPEAGRANREQPGTRRRPLPCAGWPRADRSCAGRS